MEEQLQQKDEKIASLSKVQHFVTVRLVYPYEIIRPNRAKIRPNKGLKTYIKGFKGLTRTKIQPNNFLLGSQLERLTKTRVMLGCLLAFGNPNKSLKKEDRC